MCEMEAAGVGGDCAYFLGDQSFRLTMRRVNGGGEREERRGTDVKYRLHWQEGGVQVAGCAVELWQVGWPQSMSWPWVKARWPQEECLLNHSFR